MNKLLKNKKGERVMFLGNEAIIRGALESGVQFVSTYPGTPASEIGNNFFALQKELKDDPKFLFEFSTNEKTAMEAAIGANFSGLKTLVAMKNFGLNVALEPLLPLAYTGTRAPMVIFVADDPGCH
ncbi:MAG: indolepyruvate ferredoxin oxidoreductase subunit alpha, partial [Bacteroidia bacterium]|nr:indolepyruvate ferredoxin oxidoreductase subunit alpha [Bacteroidia bacterium]